MTWRRILIHHSGARDSNGADAAAIRRYHVKHKGWKDIGYHGLVELVAGHYVFTAGRPLAMAGSHEVSQNRTALGLCLVGDFSAAPPPVTQVEIAAIQCAEWCLRFGIQPAEIRPHLEFKATACPGLVDMSNLRARVAVLLANG